MFPTPAVRPIPLALSTVALSRREYLVRVRQLVDVHVEAMNYPASSVPERCQLWTENADRADFRCHVVLAHPLQDTPDATNPSHSVAGVCYSFRGSSASWWHQQVLLNLRRQNGMTDAVRDVLADYTELSEIHVRPQWQDRGVGTRLLTLHLREIRCRTVVLSTPEVPEERNRAWSLYRKLGFTDLARQVQFDGDPRPFAILLRRPRATDLHPVERTIRADV